MFVDVVVQSREIDHGVDGDHGFGEPRVRFTAVLPITFSRHSNWGLCRRIIIQGT